MLSMEIKWNTSHNRQILPIILSLEFTDRVVGSSGLRVVQKSPMSPTRYKKQTYCIGRSDLLVAFIPLSSALRTVVCKSRVSTRQKKKKKKETYCDLGCLGYRNQYFSYCLDDNLSQVLQLQITVLWFIVYMAFKN
eukprot:TRINITY_DN5137_c0_g1_i13.p1 TRINITY_DN5137_c0_g1~~TRINITY_DN5137_c0_g1_i13.p1  ORF type:complete len:136 (-),score=7.22 TRINITY_DN5137_c0_g1_i13:192-599(-)